MISVAADLKSGAKYYKDLQFEIQKSLSNYPEDTKKAIEVAIELKYSQCLQTFLNYKLTYENQNNHVI